MCGLPPMKRLGCCLRFIASLDMGILLFWPPAAPARGAAVRGGRPSGLNRGLERSARVSLLYSEPYNIQHRISTPTDRWLSSNIHVCSLVLMFSDHGINGRVLSGFRTRGLCPDWPVVHRSPGRGVHSALLSAIHSTAHFLLDESSVVTMYETTQLLPGVYLPDILVLWMAWAPRYRVDFR